MHSANRWSIRYYFRSIGVGDGVFVCKFKAGARASIWAHKTKILITAYLNWFSYQIARLCRFVVDEKRKKRKKVRLCTVSNGYIPSDLNVKKQSQHQQPFNQNTIFSVNGRTVSCSTVHRYIHEHKINVHTLRSYLLRCEKFRFIMEWNNSCYSHQWFIWKTFLWVWASAHVCVCACVKMSRKQSQNRKLDELFFVNACSTLARFHTKENSNRSNNSKCQSNDVPQAYSLKMEIRLLRENGFQNIFSHCRCWCWCRCQCGVDVTNHNLRNGLNNTWKIDEHLQRSIES